MEDNSWKDVVCRHIKLRAGYGILTLMFFAIFCIVYSINQTDILEAIEKTGLTEDGIRSLITVSVHSILMAFVLMLTVYFFLTFINNSEPVPTRGEIAEEVGELRKELDELKAVIAENGSVQCQEQGNEDDYGKK